jgi:hypothetical protein
MPRTPRNPPERLIAWLADFFVPNFREPLPERKPRRHPEFGGRIDYRGLRLTAEARAALAGVLVALMFVTFLVARLDPAGSSPPGSDLTAVSAKTIPAVWVVHTGQTFGEISAQTGVSVTQIEDLNPYVDPGALQVGERIRLKPAAPKR